MILNSLPDVTKPSGMCDDHQCGHRKDSEVHINYGGITICQFMQLWLDVGVFFTATSLRMNAACQQLQTQARAHSAAASGLPGRTELRLHMPPLIPFATRGRLQGLRLQLTLLDLMN